MRRKVGSIAWVAGALFFYGATSAAKAQAADKGPPATAVLPVPEAALQVRARQIIRQTFQKELAKTGIEDRRALARELLSQGRETTDDAALRFVALWDAADLAAGTGDAPTALAAIGDLARLYAVNGLELRRAALLKAHAVSGNAADSEQIMQLALATAEEAATVDAFDVVVQLANLAEAAANKTRQVKIVAGIQTQLAELRALAEEFGRVKAAFVKLERDATDAEAHLVIGRFYALHKGQWELGLGHLAAGSDKVLRELATKELARPADGFAQVALGDGWWDYAGKLTGSAAQRSKAIVQDHARQWYAAAQKSIQGITLARIASRMEGGSAQAGGPTVRAGLPEVDLLALVDPAKDGAQGKWSRAARGLACESSTYACAVLPYQLPEEYDLRVRFTRVGGEGSIALLLSAKGRGFGLVLDIKGEARLERVNGKIAKDNPTTVPVAISNGRAYAVKVEVRKDEVRAFLDGKPLTHWKTDYKDMTRYAVWKLGDNTLCGVGANNAQVVFSGIDLVAVTGKGKATR